MKTNEMSEKNTFANYSVPYLAPKKEYRLEIK